MILSRGYFGKLALRENSKLNIWKSSYLITDKSMKIDTLSNDESIGKGAIKIDLQGIRLKAWEKHVKKINPLEIWRQEEN